ncbi:MAG: hypothetical protein AAF414_14250 [Pseudomonadota bacterium]
MIDRSTTRLAAAAALCCSFLLPTAGLAQTEQVGGIYDRLAEIGITRDQVIEINTYPQTDGSDGRSRGSTAWIKVAQCPEGSIVMDVGRTGVVTSAWTSGNCEIPALDDC